MSLQLFDPQGMAELVVRFCRVGDCKLPSRRRMEYGLDATVKYVRRVSRRLPQEMCRPVVERTVGVHRSVPVFGVRQNEVRVIFLLRQMAHPLLAYL